jgi:hypothetical protein
VPELRLGINLCFARKRWTQPGEWLPLVRDRIGVDVVEFCSDILDPLLTPLDVQVEMADRIREQAGSLAVEVLDYYTGIITHCLCLLSDPDARLRQVGISWCKSASKLAAAMGARGIGGHFDTIPYADWSDPKRYAACIDRLAESAKIMARDAKAAGLEFVLWEQMYTPSEIPYRIAQARDFYRRANEGAAVPIYATVDVGHACCQNYEHSPEDRDPYAWLREFGASSPVIHIQQTDANGSHHWPFTPQYNAKGIVKPEKVIDALEKSGSKRNYLIFEIFHSLATPEDQMLDELAESARYWKQHI